MKFVIKHDLSPRFLELKRKSFRKQTGQCLRHRKDINNIFCGPESLVDDFIMKEAGNIPPLYIENHHESAHHALIKKIKISASLL